MRAQHIQPVLWFLFFLYYTVYKYLASVQEWRIEFALQVAILSLMTIVAPYYLTRLSIQGLSGKAKIATMALLPFGFSLVGYIVFYATRIIPYFEGVSLRNDVMPRSIFPGVVLAVIFFIGHYLASRNSRQSVS